LLPEPILALPATERVKNGPITAEIESLSALLILLRAEEGSKRGEWNRD